MAKTTKNTAKKTATAKPKAGTQTEIPQAEQPAPAAEEKAPEAPAPEAAKAAPSAAEIINANTQAIPAKLKYWARPVMTKKLGLLKGEATAEQLECFLEESVDGVDLTKWLSETDFEEERRKAAEAKRKAKLGLK